MKNCKLTRYILIVLLCSCNVSAEHRVTLGSILFPPNTQYDPKSGECVGKSITTSRNILKNYNIKVDVVCASAIRIYRMLRAAEIDFTINIKSTNALAPHAEFVTTPYRQLILNLYTYTAVTHPTSTSAIRGFDYHGFREKYVKQGYEFIDLPNVISAIQVFVRQRSDGLLSYQAPFEFYLAKNNLGFRQKIIITELVKINSYYAISKRSRNLIQLKEAFNDYAKTNNLQYFLQ